MLVALICSLCVWLIYQSHEEARHNAIENSQNVALVAQRDILRNIEIVSLSMDALAHRFQNTIYQNLTNSQKHSYLFGNGLEMRHIALSAIVDARGEVVATSLPGVPGHNYADRPYFTIHRDRFEVGLYISKPLAAKFDDSRQAVVLSKRLSNIDGSFAGVVVIALELDYFQELFSGIALGEDGVISLYSRDGIIYMRVPSSTALVGRDMSKSPNFLQVRDAIQHDSGNFFIRSSTDGIERLFSFRSVPGTRLVVMVGRSEKDIYREWRNDVYGTLVMMSLGGLVFLALFWVLRKELRKRVEAEEKLNQLARVDGLTKLINRRTLDDLLKDLWSVSQRGNVAFSILFIDVDHFKLYNDTYGHQKGDDVLASVAEAITSALPRSSDVAARYGGEEFVAVLAETEAPGAMLVGEKIRNAIEMLKIPHSRSQFGHVTASIGVATYDRTAHASIEAVLNAADGALYEAKGSGRNQVKLSSAPAAVAAVAAPAAVTAS
ncbi:sensor domain-containing diguanylate cyclase [Herbaspirillum sp. meg3]|uniref:sensor domain-containing diguanylate cyclase n=1 Tax=Herbaspirillum sp. meg3 TaxID=2025949 RepID=UPI001E2D7EE9|nr:sensor domain-containing diguanylate cyclase [Herbaspirillum sp. meg3]